MDKRGARPDAVLRRIAFLPLACSLLGPLSAQASDDHHTAHHIQGARFDVHADVGGYASLGAGVRVDIPIAPSGILANVDDELALSPGLDLFFYQDVYADYYDGGPYMIPSVVLQWNFYVGPHWSVFPEAGVAFYVGDADYLPRGTAVYAALDLGFGARYHFSDRNALLARISTPTGLQLGVTF